MVLSAFTYERHRMLPPPRQTPGGRYAHQTAPTCVDDLLGFTSQPQPPSAELGRWSPNALPPTPGYASPVPDAWGPCNYPQVGGGFDATRSGARIVLPSIRWPLLAPPLQPDAQGRMPWSRAVPPQPLTSDVLPAPPPQQPQPPPPQQLPSVASQPKPPALPEPGWRHTGGYAIAPFTRAPDESLRHTREFPVLVSKNARRRVWHYCSVMTQHGVLAGHFEVHALSRADIAGNGLQHRIIVYSREAGGGRYQLAMDTHPEGPAKQPRIFLLHDAQANHYRYLEARDTTRPKEWLGGGEARPVESGGAGDCLFFSVARGLGYGGHHQQAAMRLRRMATSYLFHHPDAELNGDTIALFVSKL